MIVAFMKDPWTLPLLWWLASLSVPTLRLWWERDPRSRGWALPLAQVRERLPDLARADPSGPRDVRVRVGPEAPMAFADRWTAMAYPLPAWSLMGAVVALACRALGLGPPGHWWGYVLPLLAWVAVWRAAAPRPICTVELTGPTGLPDGLALHSVEGGVRSGGRRQWLAVGGSRANVHLGPFHLHRETLPFLSKPVRDALSGGPETLKATSGGVFLTGVASRDEAALTAAVSRGLRLMALLRERPDTRSEALADLALNDPHYTIRETAVRDGLDLTGDERDLFMAQVAEAFGLDLDDERQLLQAATRDEVEAVVALARLGAIGSGETVAALAALELPMGAMANRVRGASMAEIRSRLSDAASGRLTVADAEGERGALSVTTPSVGGALAVASTERGSER